MCLGVFEYSIALITFSVEPPPGLSIDFDTRVLSGVPAEPGTRTFVWRATDQRGRTADVIVSVEIDREGLEFERSAYELGLTTGQEIMETLPFARGGTGMVTYALDGVIPAGTTYDSADNTLTGTVEGVGSTVARLMATDSATPTANTAEARVVFNVASPFDDMPTIVDGARYTSHAPTITRTEVREPTDGQPGVIVALWWTSGLPNTGHEIEQTLNALVTMTRTTDLGNQADIAVPEEKGNARYRVRTYLTNTADHDVEVEAAGKKTGVVSGATVYSPYSESVVVNWGVGGGVDVDVDADGPADPNIGMMQPPVAQFVGDIATTLGMPERSLPGFYAFLTLVLGMVGFAAVTAIAGLTLPAIFLGASVATLLWFSGGTFLLGVPWYIFGVPLAVLVAVTIMFYVRRGSG